MPTNKHGNKIKLGQLQNSIESGECYFGHWFILMN